MARKLKITKRAVFLSPMVQAEGVDKSAVRRSVLSGIAQMKKYLQKNF